MVNYAKCKTLDRKSFANQYKTRSEEREREVSERDRGEGKREIDR